MFVNDSLLGEHILVPIFNNSDMRPGDPLSYLFYKVNGKSNKFFNLISDGCTSVNAFYEWVYSDDFYNDHNVITQIGVTAVGNSGACTNITVNHKGNCEVLVNGGPPASGPVDGIHVKHYTNSSRVRISVPNCADTQLVMWLFCTSYQVDREFEDSITVNTIRYVVMRGLNLNEKSHGLIGSHSYYNTCQYALYYLCAFQVSSGMYQ